MTAAANASGLRWAYSVRVTGSCKAHTACACPFSGFSTTALGSQSWRSQSARMRASS